MQVVCKDLRQILQQAVTTLSPGEESDQLFSPSSWIAEPFELVVHNRREIVKRHSELEDGDAKKHLEWFLERLEAHQPSLWQKQDEILSGSCRQILFKHLWLLYPPGSTVFSVDGGAWRAYIIERCETVIRENAAILQIHVCYLDFDGTGRRLIPHRTTIEVTPYASERQVSALRLKPEWHVEQTTSLVAKLIKRGDEYFGFGGEPRYMEYKGDAWSKTSHDVTKTLELSAYAIALLMIFSPNSRSLWTTQRVASTLPRLIQPATKMGLLRVLCALVSLSACFRTRNTLMGTPIFVSTACRIHPSGQRYLTSLILAKKHFSSVHHDYGPSR